MDRLIDNERLHSTRSAIMHKSDLGLVGLAVMGRNLTLNMLDKGYRISVYNRTSGRVDEFIQGEAKGGNAAGAYSLKELVDSLKRPRIILLMVRAGEAVDKIIGSMAPLLNQGDLLIDGGNSLFKDTMRRARELEKVGLLFLGTGISGGEEGALKGPSIMAGGSPAGWELAAPVLKAIAAKTPEGMECCAYFGPGGSGHYVKMVHNGIEYALMQAIAECYFIMKKMLKMPVERISRVFSRWSEGKLNSYLVEITARILNRIDEDSGKPLVELILDTAGLHETGKWAAQEALDLGVPLPTIAEAVFCRYISALKEERLAAARIFHDPASENFKEDEETFINDLESALYASVIIAYAQGFALLDRAAVQYGWNLDPVKVASIWRAGCIIRAQLLESIIDAYSIKPDLKNIMIAPPFAGILSDSAAGWRRVICLSVKSGITAPIMASALSYLDLYRTDYLPSNLIQAQRDCFGAHGFKRN